MKVVDGFFLIGLSNVDADRAHNIQLLTKHSWFNVPRANQRRATIAIEKGAPGERAFKDALTAGGTIRRSWIDNPAFKKIFSACSLWRARFHLRSSASKYQTDEFGCITPIHFGPENEGFSRIMAAATEPVECTHRPRQQAMQASL